MDIPPELRALHQEMADKLRDFLLERMNEYKDGSARIELSNGLVYKVHTDSSRYENGALREAKLTIYLRNPQAMGLEDGDEA